MDSTQGTGTGIAPAFAEGLDPNDPGQLAARVTDLEGQVATLTKERDDALEAATSDEALSALTKERDDAIARADAAEKALKAKPKAAAVKDPAPKLRKFKLESRDPAAAPADEQARRDALREQLQGADDVEIVQIDENGKEIAGSQPIHVSGEVWRDHAIGLMLDKPIEFRGSDQVYKLAGFGLLIDGKQAGVQIRHEPVVVHAGQQVKLERDIAF